MKISKEKVQKITNERRRKRKDATTNGVTRHKSKRFTFLLKETREL
jgi:hypothetical protein